MACKTVEGDRASRIASVANMLELLRTGPKGVKQFAKEGFPPWLARNVVDRGWLHWFPAWTPLNLSGARLVKLRFDRVHSSRADFSGADLTRSDLAFGSLPKGNFAGAILRGSRSIELRLIGANLQDADCSNANMHGASLRNARCTNASFADADLSYANLRGADLTGANLTGANLREARYDENTKWPKGFKPTGEMRWMGAGVPPTSPKRAAQDIDGLMTRLHGIIDPKRMKRTLDMLKAEKHQLFAEVEATMVRGVIRSQRRSDLVYSCVLTQDGIYSCATPDVKKCMGLLGEPCKHLLVLVIGLTRAGLLDPRTADRWILAAKAKNPRWNKTVQGYVTDSLLKYKGAEAGLVDWRPTETIPEDYYAM
jgi:hypothetical protein